MEQDVGRRAVLGVVYYKCESRVEAQTQQTL
jgi:hypothetical protein